MSGASRMTAIASVNRIPAKMFAGRAMRRLASHVTGSIRKAISMNIAPARKYRSVLPPLVRPCRSRASSAGSTVSWNSMPMSP